MTPFDFRPRSRVLFGPGEFARLGEVARELNATRCLLIADQAMLAASYAQEATRSLKARRMEVFAFHEFAPNPSVAMVEAAREFAAPLNINLIAALGGGSSMDFAKAVNVVLSNGGSIRDYRGYGNIPSPLLPMIAIPTSAGTGKEALSGTSIVDPEARSNSGSGQITCGDPKIFFRAVVLDPKLTLSQPDELTSAAGYHAVSQAIETLASTKRTPISECYSREAWRLLDENFEHVLGARGDITARGAMLLGAHFAGVATEYSSLGPAHACAQPLTTHFKLSQGVAAALVLSSAAGWLGEPSSLIRRLSRLTEAAGLPRSLREASVPESALPRLADEAAAQWSGRFSSRTFDAHGALEIYEAAY